MNFNPADIQLKDMFDLEKDYSAYVNASQERSIDLGEWIPALASRVRPLVPGEFAVIMSDTGVGKTAIAQNIARAVAPQVVFLFELELPGTLCFERFISMESGIMSYEIEKHYQNGKSVHGVVNMENIHTCENSSLTVDNIHSVIEYQRDNGLTADLVIIDYIGLLDGERNKSRHERITNYAQDLKRMAKSAGVVVLATTQIHRKGDDYPDQVTIHDARDSGAIEESAGVLIGAWKDPDDQTKRRLCLKVLKSTKDGSSDVINCEFDGPTMRIRPEVVGMDLSEDGL